MKTSTVVMQLMDGATVVNYDQSHLFGKVSCTSKKT